MKTSSLRSRETKTVNIPNVQFFENEISPGQFVRGEMITVGISMSLSRLRVLQSFKCKPETMFLFTCLLISHIHGRF